jgi:hypothetical protein
VLRLVTQSPEGETVPAFIELAWWWEEPSKDDDADDVPLRGDVAAARAYLAGIGRRSEVLWELGGFLREDAPWAPATIEPWQVIERIATALAEGRARIAEGPRAPMPALETAVEVAMPLVQRKEAEPEVAPVEEPCWPCLARAAASAAALRGAAAGGTPFVKFG